MRPILLACLTLMRLMLIMIGTAIACSKSMAIMIEMMKINLNFEENCNKVLPELVVILLNFIFVFLLNFVFECYKMLCMFPAYLSFYLC